MAEASFFSGRAPHPLALPAAMPEEGWGCAVRRPSCKTVLSFAVALSVLVVVPAFFCWQLHARRQPQLGPLWVSREGAVERRRTCPQLAGPRDLRVGSRERGGGTVRGGAGGQTEDRKDKIEMK